MKLIRYLFRKAMLPFYGIIAMGFAFAFYFAASERATVFRRMLPVALCLLLTMRAADDLFDYERDRQRKTQHLSKTELMLLFCTTAALYVTLNILFYGWPGAISFAAVGYILLQEKFSLLKPVYMPLLFFYYFAVNHVDWNGIHFAVIAGCLLLSSMYSVIKRKARI